MDFINVRDSGKATAEGVQKAYEKAAQAAAVSGDLWSDICHKCSECEFVILKFKSTVLAKPLSNLWMILEQLSHVPEIALKNIEDGARSAGNVVREEAKSASDAWQDAVKASSDKFRAEMKRQG